MAQKSFKVLITEPIPENVVSYLEKHAEVHIGKKGQFQNERNLVKAIPEFDGLLSMLSNPVTRKVLEAG